MVAPIGPSFDSAPSVNLARCYLHRTAAAVEAGDVIAAGCLLREAVRRQLFAMCEWFDCKPKTKKRITPAGLIAALEADGIVEKGWAGCIRKMIAAGNRAAHCRHVERRLLRNEILFFHDLIDEHPCGELFERLAHCLPDPGWTDDDDNDAADAWKGGAV